MAKGRITMTILNSDVGLKKLRSPKQVTERKFKKEWDTYSAKRIKDH